MRGKSFFEMAHTGIKNNTRTLLYLLIILVVGFALRLYKLDAYSVFFDEKSTLVVSQGIVLEGANQKEVFATRTVTAAEFWKAPEYSLKKPLISRSFTFKESYTPRPFTPKEFWAPKSIADYYEAMTRSDIGNSPFYYLLLHNWISVFGITDFSVRFFSVIFSMLIIGLSFIFARRFFDDNTALITATLVAFDPFFIAYSHQARNYSLTFFLTLLATYFFLRIVENKENRKTMLWLCVGYALAAGLSLLSHFLSASVLIAHAIYAVFFMRGIKAWVRMGVTASFALSGLVWWLLAGGGIYTLSSLAYQAALYKRTAIESPFNNPYGTVLPATITNVFNKAVPIFSDLMIFTNGLTEGPIGKRNLVVSVLAGIILILWYRFRDKINPPQWLASRLPYLLIIATTLFYSNHKAQFAIFSVVIFALSFIPDLHRQASPEMKKRLWLLYMMSLVPTLFLIFMAFRGGHTFGLTQRYSGFSFPFVIILVSLLLQYYAKLGNEFRLVIFVFLALQLYFVGVRLLDFYKDNSPKYSYYSITRAPNPYMIAAEKIKEVYQKGDTIYYPGPPSIVGSEMDRTFLDYWIREAQMTNLYLPKDSEYVQDIDTTQSTKIWIKRGSTGDTLQISDLKGKQY